MLTTNASGRTGTSTNSPPRCTCRPPTSCWYTNVRNPVSRWAPTPWRSLTDAAVDLVAGWRAVADDLEQHLGRVDRGVEAIGGLAQRLAHRVEEAMADALRGPPSRRSSPAAGRAVRSATGWARAGAATAGPRSPSTGRRQLAADVDLVAQVDPAVGVLVAEAGVAAELRRPHVVDLLAVVVVEGEELGGDPAARVEAGRRAPRGRRVGRSRSRGPPPAGQRRTRRAGRRPKSPRSSTGMSVVTVPSVDPVRLGRWPPVTSRSVAQRRPTGSGRGSSSASGCSSPRAPRARSPGTPRRPRRRRSR